MPGSVIRGSLAGGWSPSEAKVNLLRASSIASMNPLILTDSKFKERVSIGDARKDRLSCETESDEVLKLPRVV